MYIEYKSSFQANPLHLVSPSPWPLDSFDYINTMVSDFINSNFTDLICMNSYIIHIEHCYLFSLLVQHSVPIISYAVDAITGIKGPGNVGEALAPAVLGGGMLLAGYLSYRWKQYQSGKDDHPFIKCNLLGVNAGTTRDGEDVYYKTVIFDEYDRLGKTLHKIFLQGTGLIYPNGLTMCRITLPDRVITTACFVMDYDNDWRFDERFSERFMEEQRQLSYIYKVHYNLDAVNPVGGRVGISTPQRVPYTNYGIWAPISFVAEINIFLNTERYKVLCGASVPQVMYCRSQDGDPYVTLVHIPTYLNGMVEINFNQANFALFPE